MNVKPGDYIMWFTRYGSTEARTEFDIESCYELAHMLDDCESAIFDQYGCLGAVEKVGEGVIPDAVWERGFAAWKARVQAEYEAELAAEEPRPKVIGSIEVAPPDGRERRFGWYPMGNATTIEDLEAKHQRAIELFGDDRVRVRKYNKLDAE